METVETEALLVRSVDYRDADKIVTLLTTELGKVGVIAYGARHSKRRFSGTLQPFQLLRVVLKSRRARELLELVDADVLEAYPSIPGDPRRYAHAAYTFELAREITPESERDPRQVEILLRFLRKIDGEGASPSGLAAVLLSLLAWGGFAPAIDHCAVCGRKAPSGKAGHFEMSRGVVCSSCGGGEQLLRGRVRAALLAASTWRAPTTCTEEELAPAVLLVCAFAHEQIGKELTSWGLLERFLRS